MQNIAPELLASRSVVHVCVAVIVRCVTAKAPEVLIAKRPAHIHQGGLWEFPGGKVEGAEDVIQALKRELFEELGIQLTVSNLKDAEAAADLEPLIQIRHDYPDKTVLLDVWKVSAYQGLPHGKEGQPIRWVTLHGLNNYAFPAANLPIISACLLPNRYFITPVYPSLLDAERSLRHALSKQAELIYLRQPQLDRQTYQMWLHELLERLPELAECLMQAHCYLPKQVPAQGPKRWPNQVSNQDSILGAGLHLSFKEACRFEQRPIERSKWLAVSCHNEAELAQAEKLGADFVTLSPVLETRTHPDHEALGWERFKQLVAHSRLPVFALGGLSEIYESKVKALGAQGVAGIGFWQP